MKTRYTITLETTKSPIDPIIGLRWLLKRLLRGYGLKCIRCEELKPEEATK